MIVQYNGKNYNGFQKQPKGNTIQNEIENALKIIFKQDILTTGSGRTDAGVSAYMQPVHFDIEKEIDTSKTQKSLNGILGADIKTLSITPTNLHARFDAKQKTYQYKMYVSNIDLPLCVDALKLNPSLDFKAMKKFLNMLIGTHDFAGFQASGSQTETTTRTIHNAKLVRDGVRLNLYITGNRFLYKMVRNIVGTMLKVGEHKIQLKDLKNTLFTTYKCATAAKPEHLYLMSVDY